MSQTNDLPDVNEWRKWDPKSKEKFLARLQDSEKPKLVWYCKKGRSCDGKPHDEYDYPHARGDQWPPPGTDWLTWLLKGGRGSGKTRSGAEWVRFMATRYERGSIIGPTVGHVRDTMVEGDSGLLVVFANAKINALWEPSKRRITIDCQCTPDAALPKHMNGHIIQCFTGDEPERLRGPQHAYVWLDEPAHFALIQAVWDNMQFGLRLGDHPRILCSTTPLPTKWMKELIKEEDTVSVTVSTYANMDNLAPTFRKVMLKKYEGTRLGRQELHGEVLEDIQGALWTWALIEENRKLVTIDSEGNRHHPITIEEMERIIVAIDPAGTSSKKRDETGIVVVGKFGDHYYVIEDASGTYTPEGWASKAWEMFDKYKADKVVAEKNYGGEMVLSTLRNSRKGGPVDLVTSRRGKALRAEPVVGLYEQGRVHHLDLFSDLETQMTEWVPGMADSPDRVDALVHGITKLYEGAAPSSFASPAGRTEKAEPIPGTAPAPQKTNRFQRTRRTSILGYTPKAKPGQVVKAPRGKLATALAARKLLDR
jgi:phage terminase large subunit-like protein